MSNETMKNLQRLLKSQEFKSEEELNKFLSLLQDKQIPEFPNEALSNPEKAQDLVYQAYDSSKTKGIKLALQSLELDPDCILAYQYLGDKQNNLNEAKRYFQKGIDIGKKLYGGEFEEENKGHFWMIYETRTYMTCLFNMAECEYFSDNIDEAIRLLEYMLTLNPSDNQGVRYILSSYLIEAEKYKKLVSLFKKFDEDGGVFFLFNKALYEFIQSGKNLKSNRLLIEAIKHNKYVIPKFRLRPKKKSGSYTLGSGEEAEYYCQYNTKTWKNNKGAIDWATTLLAELKL